MSESVVFVLQDYEHLVRRRSVLKEMLMRLHSVTDKDAIEILCFSRKLPHQESGVPNHTGSPEQYVSGFQEAFWRRHQREVVVCINEYHALDMKIGLIEAAVASLPERYARLIEALFFRNMTWDTVEGELNISRHTISKWRKTALGMLEQIWESYADVLLAAEETISTPSDTTLPKTNGDTENVERSNIRSSRFKG